MYKKDSFRQFIVVLIFVPSDSMQWKIILFYLRVKCHFAIWCMEHVSHYLFAIFLYIDNGENVDSNMADTAKIFTTNL